MNRCSGFASHARLDPLEQDESAKVLAADARMAHAVLIDAFVAGAGPQQQEAARAAGVGEALAEIVEQARDAVDGLTVEPSAFVSFVAARVPAEAELPAALQGLAVADLVLAHRCHLGDPLAVELFIMRHQADTTGLVKDLGAAGQPL